MHSTTRHAWGVPASRGRMSAAREVALSGLLPRACILIASAITMAPPLTVAAVDVAPPVYFVCDVATSDGGHRFDSDNPQWDVGDPRGHCVGAIGAASARAVHDGVAQQNRVLCFGPSNQQVASLYTSFRAYVRGEPGTRYRITRTVEGTAGAWAGDLEGYIGGIDHVSVNSAFGCRAGSGSMASAEFYAPPVSPCVSTPLSITQTWEGVSVADSTVVREGQTYSLVLDQGYDGWVRTGFYAAVGQGGWWSYLGEYWGTVTYTVSLVRDGQEAPVAVIHGPGELAAGEAGQFDGTDSYDPDGGSVIEYAWDFGDGGTARGQEVTHAYARAGTYEATLTVTDSDGQTGSSTQAVKLARTATSLSYTGDASLDALAVLQLRALLTAGDCTPVQGRSVQFTWSGGNVFVVTDADGVATYDYAGAKAAGAYPLTLSFAGDECYSPSKAYASFRVTSSSTGVDGQGKVAYGVTIRDQASFAINAREGTPAAGSFTVTDLGRRKTIVSTGIATVTISAARNTATVTGSCTVNGVAADFALVVTDGAPDTLSLVAGGYSVSGKVTAGGIQIQ